MKINRKENKNEERNKEKQSLLSAILTSTAAPAIFASSPIGFWIL